MKENPNEAATFVMLQVVTWIRGTVAQGDRLLATQSHGNFDRVATVIEEEFFVVAARKLVRWVAQAKRQGLLADSAFPELRSLRRSIIDIRDMREHADDYIVREKGKKQSEFHYSPQDDTGAARYSSDATATIVLEGNYLIGGRLSVQAVMAAATAARKELPAIIQNSRFHWLASSLGSG